MCWTCNTDHLEVAAWEIPIIMPALSNSFGIKTYNFLKLGKICTSASYSTLGNVVVMISMPMKLAECMNWVCMVHIS